MVAREATRHRSHPPAVSRAIGPARCSSALAAPLAAGSPAQRRARLEGLSATVGNRGVARLVAADRRRIQRTPVTPAIKLPAAAVTRLSGMGVSSAQITALEQGQMVLYELHVAGKPSTYALLQIRGGLLRGGIFSIQVKDDVAAGVKAFFRFRQPVLELARDMGLPEIELFGAAIHNADINAMLKRQGFVETTETIPEYLGMGPNAEVQIMSKRFPVPGAKTPPTGGGTPPTGGTVPPAGEGAKPPAGGGPGPSATAPKEGPAVTTGPAAEPGGAKVGEAPVTSELPPTGEIPVVRPRFTMGSVVGLAGNVLATLVLWWVSSKLAAWQEQFVATQFATKVDPHVRDAMAKQAAVAEKLTAEDPSQPVYANVTVDIKYGNWSGSVGGSEAIYAVDFVGPVTISRNKVSTEHIVSQTSDCVSGGGYGCANSGTRRVTYSVEVKFDETQEQHFWRLMASQAEKDVKAGRSVRVQAELGDFDDLQLGKKRDSRWENQGVREQQRKEKLAYKIRWTRLYMQAAAKRFEYAELYREAKQYLDELQGKAAPVRQGPMTVPGPRTPAERKQLEDWLKASGG
jgi:hypothetical protein